MKNLILAFAFVTLVGPSAFASTHGKNNNGQKPGDTSTVDLSFEDLRAACLNPSRFHNQVAPKNIQISCRDIQSKWVPDTDGALSMISERQVTSAVQSDKYTSAAVTSGVPMSPQVVSCPKFKEVAETVESIRAVSCDELVAFTGTSIDFCAGAINTLRAANPQAIASVETGRVIDPCTLEAARPSQRQR